MPQYIKHYWTDNRGNYQTVANQTVDRRHPNLEGLSVKYWLTDAKGVDYCLSVCPETTVIDTPPVGIEVITKTEWDAIVATIPPPPDPPVPPQPNWELFRSSIASAPEMQAILGEAIQTVPQAVVNLTTAVYKLDSGEYYDFQMAWNEVMNSVTIDLTEFKQTLVELATSCNLPGDFITILS